MFDSTPMKRARAPRRPEYANQNATTRAAGDKDAAIFDILAVWDDGLDALRDQVDAVSGWGPYELFEAIPLFEGKDGRRRVLCRFMYHGAPSDRFSVNSKPQFKYALLNCLRQVTEWEDVAGQSHIAAHSA